MNAEPRRKLTLADLKPKPLAQLPQQKPKAKKQKPKAPPNPPAPPGELTQAQRERRREKHRRNRRNRRIRLTPWPTISAMLVELQQRYPETFDTRPRKPLMIGVCDTIVAELGCDKYILSAALGFWCSRPAYLMAIIKGTHRHALDGSPVAELADAERASARVRLDGFYAAKEARAKGQKAATPVAAAA